MAEWLGNGLQNRVQQFDSAWYLKRKAPRRGFSFMYREWRGRVENLFYQMV